MCINPGSFAILSILPQLPDEIVFLLLTAPPEQKIDPCDLLTDREKQIFKLLAEGYIHKEITDMPGISVRTVIVHGTNIAKNLILRVRRT
ncbi:MAG: LuxR C-terminal-related transcriptional regulator [Thermosulfidibacteraceae bacterium]|jgi:DNA-binding NarL/FixJ family response regulator